MGVKKAITNNLKEMTQLLDEINNRSAVVCGLIDLLGDEQLRSESSRLRASLKEASWHFGRMYQDYVSTLEDGEDTNRVPPKGQ